MSSTLLILAKTGATAAGKAIFVKSFEALIDKCTERGVEAIKWKGNKKAKIEKIFSQILQIRKVKTLWQVDYPVDISAFYCDSHVYINEKRTKTNALSDLPSGNILIQGIAGQGKSIFLRYLAAIELARGGPIPLFIELRRIVDAPSLLDLILASLSEYGITIEEAGFHGLASTGQVTLMLDALDEVVEESKQKVIGEIEHLAKIHPEMKIVVTGRFSSGLEVSPLFEVVRLSNLEGDEYKEVVTKLMEDHKAANQLLKRVEGHHGRVRELLTTPLLVTLLVINYKSFQELPEQLSDFYEQLFYVLLRRHDGTKPGYQRQRFTKLNDTECRKVFEAFCFLSKQQKGSLSHKLVVQIATQSLKETGFKEDAEKYLRDVVSITCLLVKDGEEYRFIHKSVQEYYGACWIEEKPEVIVKSAYPKMFSSGEWSQELRFLREIDTYRFYKFGLVPAILEYLNITEPELRNNQLTKATESVMKNIENSKLFIFTLSREIPKVFVKGEFAFGCSSKKIATCEWECSRPIYENLYDKDEVARMLNSRQLHFLSIDEGRLSVAMKEMLISEPIKVAMKKAAQEIATHLLRAGKQGMEFIEKAETDALFSIQLPL